MSSQAARAIKKVTEQPSFRAVCNEASQFSDFGSYYVGDTQYQVPKEGIIKFNFQRVGKKLPDIEHVLLISS